MVLDLRVKPKRPNNSPKGNTPLSEAVTIPAPNRGLYLAQNIADAQGSALVMDNIISRVNGNKVRKGSASRNTGLTAGTIECFMSWSGGSSSKIFVCDDDSIYDITTAGAVGAAAVTGLSSTDLKNTTFTTAGGWFLYWVNGVDSAQYYDGSTWTTPTPTLGGSPYATTNFTNIWSHASRLWVTIKNTLQAHYLPTDSLTGALTPLNVGSQTQLGGYLVAGTSSSLNAGDGVAAYNIFMTSNGEVVVYKGLDPSSSTTFTWVGTYKTGKPISKNCFLNISGDVLVMTEDGIVGLTQIMQMDRGAVAGMAITAPIEPLWRQYIAIAGYNESWSMKRYNKEGVLLVTLPATISSNAQQLCVTLATGQWCVLKNWQGRVFEECNGVFLGGFDDGVVYTCFTGGRDNGSPIYGRIMYGYAGQESSFRHKNIKAVRPSFRTNVPLKYAVAIREDYVVTDTGAVDYSPFYAQNNQPRWNTMIWNAFNWASNALFPVLKWTPAFGSCSFFAVDIAVCVDGEIDAEVEINSVDVLVQQGGLLT